MTEPKELITLKLKKLLPILILALALVYFFLPGAPETGTAAPAPAQSVQAAPQPAAEQGGGELVLLPESASEPDAAAEFAAEEPAAEPAGTTLDENGSYTTKEDLALYIHTFGHLPPNFITKKDAEKAGWSGGSLEKVLPGMCIGGDRFGNYEGLLPKAKGRSWTECDVNTLGAKSRGAERIVFSNDGLIFYTADHYDSFEQLYG